jgi:hypothetical protein
VSTHPDTATATAIGIRRAGPIEEHSDAAEPAEAEPPDDGTDFEAHAAARQHHLFRTAYLLCGDRDRAQDLVQSTFVALLRSWKRARLADNPAAYAKKVLFRTFLSEQRRLRRNASVHAFRTWNQPATTTYGHMIVGVPLSDGKTPDANTGNIGAAVDRVHGAYDVRLQVQHAPMLTAPQLLKMAESPAYERLFESAIWSGSFPAIASPPHSSN